MKDLFDLHGQVAMITGASSGLGVQFAKALARQGAALVLLARRKEKLEQVAKDIETIGVECMPIPCDVTDRDAVQKAVDQAVAKFGRIDILVNNAGSGATGKAEELTNEDWMRVINLDLNAVFQVAQSVGRVMIKNGYGRIVNIASIYGLVSSMEHTIAPYSAAKAGVVNLTHSLAAEWAKYGVNVNAICPGTFITELTADTLLTEESKAYHKVTVPVGRCGNEGELDTTILYLTSPASSYTTGVALPVDGGFTAI